MAAPNNYNQFINLTKYNKSALESLASIREKAKEGNADDHMVLNQFLETMSNIREMGHCCEKMGIAPHNLASRIEEVESAAITAVRELEMALRFGYQQTEVASQVDSGLFKKVERLSSELREPEEKGFDINNAQTPHDLIRYMHQKGLESMFSMQNLKQGSFGNGMIKCNITAGCEISVMDLNGELKIDDFKNPSSINCNPLRALVESYKSDRLQEKKGREDFNIISEGNKMIAYIIMGCHYSEVEANIGEGRNYIKFLFMDTSRKSYKNSAQRSNYVRNVLRRLGFCVTGKGQETKALLEGKPEEETSAKFQELIRLIASTKDLDFDSSKMDMYLNKAVNAFMSGVTNIEKYLFQHNREWDGQDDEQ